MDLAWQTSHNKINQVAKCTLPPDITLYSYFSRLFLYLLATSLQMGFP
jgi:hypothetical protein